jgi:hypothetical protein
MNKLSQEQLFQTVEGLKQSQSIIFEAISGSHAYGTNVPTSDIDIRGLFILPSNWHLGIKSVPEEVSMSNQDTKYFELKKFVTLAADVNPNIIETLWSPEDCNRIVKWPYERLKANRSLFVSRKAFHTFSGYAYSQIRKAKGQNKMVHQDAKWEPGVLTLRAALKGGIISSDWVVKTFGNLVADSVLRGQEFNSLSSSERMDSFLEQDVIRDLRRPSHRDFCWVVLRDAFDPGQWSAILRGNSFPLWPARPLHVDRLADMGIKLEEAHAAALEHTRDVFRLYHYGSEAKGVFRGDEAVGGLGGQVLTCESIPVDDEWSRFFGLLIYNQDAYKDACGDWERYWTWRDRKSVV